jgi:uncharacterized damage-inducible protein DinB
MREWLIDGFRYDLWANRRWAPVAAGTLEEVGWPDSSDEIPTEPKARMADTFAHILWGQRIWLERLGVEVCAEGLGWLDALHERWISTLSERDPAERIEYRNTKGVPFNRPIGDIAWHMINHGTYHRGQLREIADCAGLDWPETDFTFWRSETGEGTI